MHFLFLADLIGEHKNGRLNDFTSNHFAEACRNVYTKIGIPKTQNLIVRFYMNDGKEEE